jgi:hypothetical protein
LDFSKIDPQLPSVVLDGDDIFTRAEYQEHLGVGEGMASRRLTKLQAEGTVRKVRVRRNGSLVQAWQYIPQVKKVESDKRTGFPRKRKTSVA